MSLRQMCRAPFSIVMLVVTGVGLGCATATIHKVPSRADYDNWTDADQRAADAMCGLRYYQARPYVVVSKSFPVDSKTYLVDALMSADGTRVRIIGNVPAELAKDLTHVGYSESIAARSVFKGAGGLATLAPPAAIPSATPEAHADTVPDSDGGGERPAGDPESTPNPTDTTNLANNAGGEAAPPATTGTEPPATDPFVSETESTVPTGRGDYSMVRLGADAVAVKTFDSNDYFDVIYLPDFEEQYVVDPRANLGSLDLHLTQGPGGALMSLNQKVDNSAITRPIVDAWKSWVRTASAAGQSALGLTPAVTPEAQSDSIDDGSPGAKVLRASQITLRIHVTSFAAPGMYPILKASEVIDNRRCMTGLQDCQCSACCSSGESARAIAERTHVLPVYARFTSEAQRGDLEGDTASGLKVEA